MPEVLRGGVFISGVFPRPQGTTHDINQSGSVNSYDEYMELFNSSDSAIDIGGLQIWDEFDGNWFTIPSGTMLAAKSTAVIMPYYDGGPGPALSHGSDIAMDAALGYSIFESTDESVVVLDPNTNSYIQVDYGAGSPNSPTSWFGFPSSATLVGAVEDFGTPVNGESLERDPYDPNSIISGAPQVGTTPICFASGTLIRTDRGDVPVEQLRAGDHVITLEGGAEPIRWVGACQFDTGQLAAKPDFWPIRIEAGALGPGIPERDLVVSPQHRILLSNTVVERMIGARQALVAAKHLQGLAGVKRFFPAGGVTYLHVMLHEHRTLLAENAPAESLYLGPEARKSLSQAALNEIAVIFPELLRGECRMAPARDFMTGKKARKLTERLTRNKKPAFADQI